MVVASAPTVAASTASSATAVPVGAALSASAVGGHGQRRGEQSGGRPAQAGRGARRLGGHGVPSGHAEAGQQVGVDTVELLAEIALWAVRRFDVGMFSAAVTAADRSISRSVMAATNCLVSASFGFFSATRRSDCSAPAMRADNCAPCPENWPS